MTLYHSAVYMPKFFKELKNTHCIIGRVTHHAKRASQNDRLGIIKIPSEINFSAKNIIELETFKNCNDKKLVIRIDYNQKNDLILVIQFSKYNNFVKTLWLNSKNDSHKTLDKSKYFNPKKGY